MQIEIDTMYQNISVKAALESGVTLVVGNSATGKSFLFHILVTILQKMGYSWCI